MTSLALSEAEIRSAPLTGVDSLNNVLLVSRIYEASSWKKGGWRKGLTLKMLRDPSCPCFRRP